MEEPGEQVGGVNTEEPRSSPEGRSFQHVQDLIRSWQQSRQEVLELYQGLQAHHSVVQSLYDALITAMSTGQEHIALLDEYHEAQRRTSPHSSTLPARCAAASATAGRHPQQRRPRRATSKSLSSPLHGERRGLPDSRLLCVLTSPRGTHVTKQPASTSHEW